MKIGVDIGGTKIEAVALGCNYTQVAKRRAPTPAKYGGIIDVACSLVSAVSGGAECEVGVCAPGPISYGTGIVRASNAQCLAGRPLKEDLEERLGKKILFENDANCFALAEARMGAGAGYGTVFGVIMGTGVGGGIVIDGQMRRGRSGLAGEWGHHPLRPGGRACHCGKTGCVEACIGGPALEARWRELGGEGMRIQDIISSKSPLLAGWKEELIEDFGLGLAGVINMLDPDIIVVGGGLSNIPFLYDEGAQSAHAKAFGGCDTPIVQNKLGDSAGGIGACLLSDCP